MNWLVKSDPDEYSADDLKRDGRTRWTGVRNPAARKALTAMKKGDVVLIYHTGDARAIVALAKVAAPVGDDAAEPELVFQRRLKQPIPLSAIKADAFFADFALVRQGRLSVMPVTAEQWTRLLALESVVEPRA